MKLLVLGLMLVLCLFCGTLVSAQSGLVFSTSAEATALNYNGSWGPATHTTELLDLVDWGAAKGSRFDLAGHEVTATPFNAYLGGGRLTPDLSALFKKTNLPADSIQLFIEGAGGLATFSTQPNHVAFLAGGGLVYRLTPSLQLSTVSVDYLRVGSHNAVQISSGLAYYFNPQASQNMAVKRMIARRAARR